MRVFWQDSEKTILIREFSREWDWEDFQESVARMRQMLQEVKHDIYIIIDGREIHSVPVGALGYFSEANRNLPPNVVMRLLVTESKLFQAFVKILQSVAPHNFENFCCVPSMEAAFAKIAKQQEC